MDATQCPGDNPAFTRYHRVLDILFPREPCLLPGGEFVLILRFVPAFDPESQIVIRKLGERDYAVRYYYLPRGSKNAGIQIADLVEQAGLDDVQELANRIRIQVEDMHLPTTVIADLMARYSQLLVSPVLDTRVILDPTWYQLWFHTTSSSSDVHFSLAGPDYGHDAKAHPLVRWMNEVKRVVEKYAAAQQ